MAESAFAEHIFKNIRAELELLKRYDYIQAQPYNEILKLLPTNANSTNKSTSTPSPYPASTTFTGVKSTPASDNSFNNSPPPPSYQTAANDLGCVEALYDYKGSDSNTDLNFCRGDIIQLIEMVNDDWWKGTLRGRAGIFPRNYVKRIEGHCQEKSPNPPPPTPARNNSNYNSYNSAYPPPPSQHHSPYPPPVQMPSYATPPPVQSSTYAPPPPQQQMTYAPPPVQQALTSGSSSVPAVAGEQPHEENKIAGFGKKLAGNVANAATWGFGATIGSDIAHSIF